MPYWCCLCTVLVLRNTGLVDLKGLFHDKQLLYYMKFMIGLLFIFFINSDDLPFFFRLVSLNMTVNLFDIYLQIYSLRYPLP